MYVALLAKNKPDFINDTYKKEDLNPLLHHLWDRCNAFVFAWIMNAVSRDPLSRNIYQSSALFIWTCLKERFNKVNASIIYQLQREICVINQGLNSISIYFNRIKFQQNEFASICGIPFYTGNQSMTHSNHENNIKPFQFMMGLNENYCNV